MTLGEGPSKAIVLAAGRGTRMRHSRAVPGVDEAQRLTAARGLKGLVPFRGQPFLAYVLSALADAGYREACLVVRPSPDPVRQAFDGLKTHRLNLSFAVQTAPTGSAHALLAAETFAAGDPVTVINADNYYPPPALAAVRSLGTSGLAGFRQSALVERGDIPRERVNAFALVTTDGNGRLSDIVEKPDAATAKRLLPDALVSMTCWRFRPVIFDACRAIAPSARGEYEIPDAVKHASRVLGEPFQVVPVDDFVLDLSQQSDIPGVAEHLRGITVAL